MAFTVVLAYRRFPPDRKETTMSGTVDRAGYRYLPGPFQ
jgi:hypothetical protein